MKDIVLIPNPNKDIGLAVTQRLVHKLLELKCRVFIDEKLPRIDGVIPFDDFPNEAELIVVIGGDGSVIDASHYSIENDIPIVGVNLGKMGYLTEVDPNNLDTFNRLLSGEYTVLDKMLLSVETENSDGDNSKERLAVNDVVITHSNFLGMCEFLLENRNSNGVKYRADGVIISTPEGSTAYSLSAGGPIVSHDLDAIVVTPVCPHSFFNRSIIFKQDERITVTNLGDEILKICIDGRFYKNINKGERCNVFAAKSRMKMLTFKEDNMFETLFKKMRILEDVK